MCAEANVNAGVEGKKGVYWPIDNGQKIVRPEKREIKGEGVFLLQPLATTTEDSL